MRLEIKNFAKIKEADITLDGITVIAGENNTGKSTVGKILNSYFKAFKRYPEKIKSQRERAVSGLIFNYVYVNQHKTNSDSLSDNLKEKLKQQIFLYLSNKSKENYESIIDVCRNEISYNSSSELFDIEEVKKLISDVEKVSEVSDTIILNSIVSSSFGDSFENQYNNVNNSSEANLKIFIKNSVSEVTFIRDTCVHIDSPIRIVNSSFFIDTPNALNNLAYSSYSSYSSYSYRRKNQNDFAYRLFGNDLLDNSSNEEQPDFISQIIANDKLNEIYRLLENTGIGSVEKQESGRYLYNSKSLKSPLEIANISMGLKAFVLLKSLLQENVIKEKDVLIFDEPEIHLHPEWQVIYAQLLVLLQVSI